MKRVLILTFDAPPKKGGIETRIKYYPGELKKKGIEATVIVFEERVLPTIDVSTSTKIIRCPSYVSLLPLSMFYVFKQFFTVKYDAVHLLSGSDTFIGFLVILLSSFVGVKAGVSTYGRAVMTARYSLSRALCLWPTLSLSDWIGANSMAMASVLPDVFKHKVGIIYPGVDNSMPYQVTKAVNKTEGKVVLYVGRLVAYKGADDLIQSFKKVVKHISNAKLRIVGEGPYRRELESLVSYLDLKDHVEFLGELEGPPLFAQYASCDIFSMPSRTAKDDTEGFGQVFLEAGIFKKPTVGTTCGGIPEAVVHGKTGLLIPEGDVEALTRSLLSLLEDPELSKKMGEEGFKRALKEFSWEQATNQLVELWEQRRR